MTSGLLLDLVVRVIRTCGEMEGLTRTAPVTVLKKKTISSNSWEKG